jgi:hypothetical protein
VERIQKAGALDYVAFAAVALIHDAVQGIGKTFRCKTCGYKW